MAIPSGFPPGTLSVDRVAQPVALVALQVRASSTDTVPVLPEPKLATYTVCVWPSIAMPAGKVPTVAPAGVWVQPARCRALQPRVSIIEMACAPEMTYVVWTAGSAASGPGRATLTAGGGFRHPRVC